MFLGLVGMMDPPRKEVIDSIAQCKSAGIDVVMITGDHKLTAIAVAREIGIIDDDTQIMTPGYIWPRTRNYGCHILK